MHVHEVIFHMPGRENGDIFDAQGLENVLLEIVVEGHLGDALDHLAGPIHSDLKGSREKNAG